MSLTCTHSLTVKLMEGTRRREWQLALQSPLLPQSPWLVLGQALEGRFPVCTLEPYGRGATSWAAIEVSRKKLDAPGSRAIVMCVGVGFWYPAASQWGMC